MCKQRLDGETSENLRSLQCLSFHCIIDPKIQLQFLEVLPVYAGSNTTLQYESSRLKAECNPAPFQVGHIKENGGTS